MNIYKIVLTDNSKPVSTGTADLLYTTVEKALDSVPANVTAHLKATLVPYNMPTLKATQKALRVRGRIVLAGANFREDGKTLSIVKVRIH